MTTMSVSFVLALVPAAEGHDHLGHYSVSRMQQPYAGTHGHALVRVCALVQAPIACCILLIVVPEMIVPCKLR